MESEETKKKAEGARREKLRKEKPLVFEKIIRLEERFRAGKATPAVDICFDRVCNLKCSHCFVTRFTPKERTLTPADLKKFSDEAHELGLCQLVISAESRWS